MNKIIILIFIIVLVLAGGWYIFNQSRQNDMENPSARSAIGDIAKDAGQDGTADSQSQYVVYTQNALDSAKDGRRVLFFYASWCPTCRPTDASFSQNSSEFPEDLTVIRVNYNDPETDDEERALADKYNVTYQHTFVQIDSEGNEITKWNGGGLEELLENVR